MFKSTLNDNSNILDLYKLSISCPWCPCINRVLSENAVDLLCTECSIGSAENFNSWAPWRCGCNFENQNAIFQLILQTDIMSNSWGTALMLMPQKTCDDKSTLVQVKACCCQATSHYLNQCWPSLMMPNGITRPEWVKCPTKLAEIDQTTCLFQSVSNVVSFTCCIMF